MISVSIKWQLNTAIILRLTLYIGWQLSLSSDVYIILDVVGKLDVSPETLPRHHLDSFEVENLGPFMLYDLLDP